MKMDRTAFRNLTSQVTRGSFIGCAAEFKAANQENDDVRFSYPFIISSQFIRGSTHSRIIDEHERLSGAGSKLFEPLLGRSKTKKSKDIAKLNCVLTDQNMLQLMERNLTSASSCSNQMILPSDRELNDLVT